MTFDFLPFARRALRPVFVLALLAGGLCQANAQTPPAAAPEWTRTEDVVYGRKFGVALTLDVIQPAKPNGYGVVFMVSGGWVSSHDAIVPGNWKPLLDRGYTVFAVCHGCQPKFIVREITEDIHRSIRFIRTHAAKWNVNPEKLGITGASAGGHLSLTMGTQGGPGKADAKDPIDRASSAVAAVACFFPPTDFLNYGAPGVDGVGVGILKGFQGAFGPESATEEGRKTLGHDISPIYFITDKTAPTLIVHGDADTLVPVQQAQSFVDKAAAAGVTAKLIVKPGAGHGWLDMGRDLVTMTDWFDEYLRGIKK